MSFYKLIEVDKEVALDNHEGECTLLLDGKYYKPVKEIKSEDYPKEEGLFIHIFDIIKK